MNQWAGTGLLVALFGAAAWAGFAWTEPAPGQAAPVVRPAIAVPNPPPLPAPPSPAGPAPPAKASSPPGDLDGGPPAPTVKPGEPVRLTFTDITQWDLDPKDVQVPQSILALSGKDIDIVGYMIPYGDPDSVEEFLLVRDLGSCCFGAAPLPHHLIECRMTGAKRTAYIPGPVRARGKFRVEEHRQGKYLISVYAMTVNDCTEVR